MTDFSDCGLGVLEGKTIATVFEKMATADLVRRGGLFFSVLMDKRESQSAKPDAPGLQGTRLQIRWASHPCVRHKSAGGVLLILPRGSNHTVWSGPKAVSYDLGGKRPKCNPL